MISKSANHRQEVFRNMFVGILLYSVVLGFFNDYTDILQTISYSITFSMAIVMQFLTYVTFAFKDVVRSWFKGKNSKGSKVALGFSIWLILFLSKFVFLAVIDFIFRDSVQISGFVGLLFIVASLTIVQQIIEMIDRKLGE
ncbi:MAG: hypothetical protein QG628_982 [Patescibacteria group bacterium]|nr:hypothetical protein [Patescibacteria group bacterium]